MKKILAASLSVLFFCGTDAWAAPIVNLENGNTGRAYGAAGSEAGTPVTITVQHEKSTSMFYRNETVTTEEGAFSFVFTFTDDDKSGVYDVSLYRLGETPYQKSIVFVSSADEAEITKALSGLKTTDEAFAALESVGEKIGVHVGEDSDFAELSDASREKVLQSLLQKTFSDTMEIRSLFCGEVATEILNYTENAADAFEAQKEALGLDVGESSLYAALDDAEKAEVHEAVAGQGFESGGALRTAFGSKVALLSLDNITKETVDKLPALLAVIEAEGYADINLKNYRNKTIGEVQKLRFLEALAAKTPYNGFEAFAAAFKKAEKDHLIKKETSTGGSGGSAGGFTSTPEKPKPVIDKTETAQHAFTDLGNVPWAAESINRLAEKGIINGVGNAQFAPDSPVSREQFVKMLAGALGLPSGKSAVFTDVAEDSVYAPYIAAAYDAGIVTGLDDATFGMGRNVTREEMAAMLSRAIGVLGITPDKIRDSIQFADAEEIAPYAADAVTMLYTCGILDGMGNHTFAPKANATRAQVAKLLDTFLEVCGR